MENLTRSEAAPVRAGSVHWMNTEHPALVERVIRAIDAHPHFKLRVGSVLVGGLANYYRATAFARRLGTTGMKRRYRKLVGEGPSPELAVDSLIEGLDHYAEILK